MPRWFREPAHKPSSSGETADPCAEVRRPADARWPPIVRVAVIMLGALACWALLIFAMWRMLFAR